MQSSKRILISRTDSIGDVILTLPMAGILKTFVPGCTVLFLGSRYTRDVVETCEHVDQFVDWSEIEKKSESEQLKTFQSLKSDIIIHVFPKNEIAKLAKRAKIPFRIGTTGRLYHYYTCNKLIPLSRRKSKLHEAQLNLKLIDSVIGKREFSLDEIYNYYGYNDVEKKNSKVSSLISTTKFNLILHPKSKGSAREWGLDNFSRLVEILPSDKFEIFITGTEEEGEMVKEKILDKFSGLNDLTGKLSLKELIQFISKADALVAASTGPLHLAAALGKQAIGIYPPIKPMHPGRWAPIGKNASYFVLDKECSDCIKGRFCECMKAIKPEQVKDKLLSIVNG